MGTNTKPVHLKAFLNKQKEKVIFAEVEQDFVEILFSFMTLPLGKIASLMSKHTNSTDITIGGLTSLYQSVVNLDVVHFSQNSYKDKLVNPVSPSETFCQKLKVNLEAGVTSSHSDAVFLKRNGSFIVTDDLYITPFLLDNSIQLLNTFGIEYVDLLDTRILYFGLEEFTDLLKWSLLTNKPLTNMVLAGNKRHSCLPNIGNLPLLLSNSAKLKTVKLLVKKSTKKVLCAEAENFFVEMLFSFLTTPLSAVKCLTMDISCPIGINKLYTSILDLKDGKYLNSEDIKTTLLCPTVAGNYLRVTDLLPIYMKNTNPGSFLKKQATFIVSDDLEILPSACFSTILKFTAGIPVGDLEVVEVRIGEPEALVILNASLTSTSVLTLCLDAFRRNSNERSST